MADGGGPVNGVVWLIVMLNWFTISICVGMLGVACPAHYCQFSDCWRRPSASRVGVGAVVAPFGGS